MRFNTHINSEGRNMKSREAIKILKTDGWYEVGVVGSHHHFKHPTKPGKVTVPHPKKQLTLATLKSIEKQSGVAIRR
jgi:predicted RNA binding protein YcfA (HicA-like mRNA interferase family)